MRGGEFLSAALILTVFLFAVGDAAAPARMMVLTGAQDSSGVFQVLELNQLGRRALVWPEGVLTQPGDAPWQENEAGELLFYLSDPGLFGIGSQGRFRFQQGRYDLDTPLLISDGELTVYLSAGILDVGPDRIIYFRPPGASKQKPGRRGEYYVLAGLVLATALLLRAARKRTR
jgi:hypothetical protein